MKINGKGEADIPLSTILEGFYQDSQKGENLRKGLTAGLNQVIEVEEKVTEEMIAAGVKAMLSYDPRVIDDDVAVESIYLSMFKLRKSK